MFLFYIFISDDVIFYTLVYPNLQHIVEICPGYYISIFFFLAIFYGIFNTSPNPAVLHSIAKMAARL